MQFHIDEIDEIDIDENKEVLKKYEEVWEVIKKEIETINNRDK